MSFYDISNSLVSMDLRFHDNMIRCNKLQCEQLQHHELWPNISQSSHPRIQIWRLNIDPQALIQCVSILWSLQQALSPIGMYVAQIQTQFIQLHELCPIFLSHLILGFKHGGYILSPRPSYNVQVFCGPYSKLYNPLGCTYVAQTQPQISVQKRSHLLILLLLHVVLDTCTLTSLNLRSSCFH